MNEFWRKFDTIRFIAPWSIFRNFLEIFHFFEFKFKFWILTGFIPDRTGTGPDRLPVKPDRLPTVRLTLPITGDFSTFVGKSTQLCFCQISTLELFNLIWVRVLIMWFTKFHPLVLKNSASSCIGVLGMTVNQIHWKSGGTTLIWHAWRFCVKVPMCHDFYTILRFCLYF